MPDQTNYYIAEAAAGEVFTAGVLRQHQENIMLQSGFRPLRFSYAENKGAWYKIKRLVQCFKIAFSVAAGSRVYFHFPFLAGVHRLLQKLLHWRGIQTIALVIDIDGWRDNDPKVLSTELAELAAFNFIVAHNAVMKNHLLKQLPASAIICIDLFDYEFKGQPLATSLSPAVCFAGNLAKSAFVYDLVKLQALHFYLYGQHFRGSDISNVSYEGAVAPELLPAILKGSFGLVWDGDSIETCHQYLRYNNPHKLSLYLAAGLTVIVWKDSAVASFVLEHKLGITIHSLAELPAAINNISVEEYGKMQQAAHNISRQVKQGFYLKKVLAQISQW